MDRYLSIGEAAKLKGVSITTLRRWEADGSLVPTRTEGGQRRYLLSQIDPAAAASRPVASLLTVAYARVSSHDQKADLERQKQVLELYCAAQGWTFEVIADLGSGMNYQKKGLRRLLNQIIEGKVRGRVVVNVRG